MQIEEEEGLREENINYITYKNDLRTLRNDYGDSLISILFQLFFYFFFILNITFNAVELGVFISWTTEFILTILFMISLKMKITQGHLKLIFTSTISRCLSGIVKLIYIFLYYISDPLISTGLLFVIISLNIIVTIVSLYISSVVINDLYNNTIQLKEINYDKEGICSICLEELNISIKIELKCEHVFHKDCIERWISMNETFKNTNCPECRDEII